MTHSELFKLHELKGRLQGRKTCLENDITSTANLVPALVSAAYKGEFIGRLYILKMWAAEIACLLEEIERIIKEAENARE